MESRATWEIDAAHTTPECLVIRDMNVGVTITNDAEAVVADLVRAGALRDGGRLMYFDTDGNLDELRIVNGRFAGFIPGPIRGKRT